MGEELIVPLAVAGASALGGAIGSSLNMNKAKKTALNYLNGEYYRDPLTMVGNKSLLKAREERRNDNLDAIDNRAAAGGATFENRLAAMQQENEVDSRLQSQLLQNTDTYRRSLAAQKAAVEQNSYLQNAQNWQAWGSAMGNAAMGVGNAALLGQSAGLTPKQIYGIGK